MKLINKYLEFVGLTKEELNSKEIIEYKSSGDLKVAQRHLDYLKENHNYHKERQTTIENKNSQLVGQASIIISIFALFIPLLIDKLVDQNILVLIPLILGFIVILFHYVLTIVHSTKTLEISKYPYATRNTNTVTSANRKTSEQDFLDEEINDLVYIIDKNTTQNNRKGANLIYATRSFRIASISFAVFTVLIIGFSFIINSKPQSIVIEAVNKEIYQELKQQIVDESKLIDIRPELKEIVNTLNKVNQKLNSIDEKLLCPTINIGHLADSAKFENEYN